MKKTPYMTDLQPSVLLQFVTTVAQEPGCCSRHGTGKAGAAGSGQGGSRY